MILCSPHDLVRPLETFAALPRSPSPYTAHRTFKDSHSKIGIHGDGRPPSIPAEFSRGVTRSARKTIQTGI